MINNNQEEESNSKSSNIYENKLENLKNEYELQAQKKNQELEELFEEMDEENKDLKKEIIQSQFELEEEKEKLKNIRNTLYNINNNNNIKNKNQEIPEIKNTETNETEYNYKYLNNNIKIIKENNEKKISEITKNYNRNLTNFEQSKKMTDLNIKEILNKDDNIEIIYKNILEENKKYYDKIELLLNENYNKEKYSISLNQKYEISKEEIYFLKQRIFQEKLNVLNKINEINNINKITHFNMIQELQNELDIKKKNYYNDKFLIPLENINSILTNAKEKEKQLENKFYKLECENNILKNKLNILTKEKNELYNKTSNFIFNKEQMITEGLLYKSEINKLKNENKILTDENNNLLKNVKDLNNQISNIDNNIQFEMKKLKKDNENNINQKEKIINELNEKINNLMSEENNYNNKVNNLNEELNNMRKKISEADEKEINFQNEIIQLKKKVNENLIFYKNAEQKQSATEEINRSLSQQLEYLQSEKANIENTSNILNNKYNDINQEYTKLKNELLETKKKNQDLELNIKNLKNKLSSMESNQELLQLQSDLLNKLQKNIRQIYQIHFSNINLSSINKDENTSNELFMLKEINERLSVRMISNNQSVNFNEDFSALEQSKNSQLYENILLYLVNLKSQNKIELGKLLNEKMNNSNNSGDTNYNSSSNFNKKYFDELKVLLEDKYKKFEQRIRNSITIGELEELLIETKNLYEAVIDSIIQGFYNYKTDLSANNILTIQIPLDKYHKIINNTNSNLINIEKSLTKRLNEYKNQGEKIESALSILLKSVNSIY